MSTTLSPSAASWLGTHHGVATTAELRSQDVGRKAVERLCAVGVLTRINRGVYVLTTAISTLEHRSRRLCCLHPGGFVTGPTAAMLAGVRRQPRLAPLHFAVRHGVHLHHVEGVRFRQTTKLRADQTWTRPDGIVVASWSRLAFDLAVHVDLGVRHLQRGIEVDVHPEHRSIEGHREDAGRYRWLHADGWQIEPAGDSGALPHSGGAAGPGDGRGGGVVDSAA